MAIVTLSKEEVKKIVGNLSDEEIDSVLSLFSTTIEKMDKETIEVEVAPNRPDMLSQQGLLRALRGFVGKKIGLQEYKLNEPEKNFEVSVEKSVLVVRPYTACAIVKGLSFNDEKIKEVIDIQEKIHTTLGRSRKKIAIGIYPLEKITLPITFEARNPKDIKFVPLEAHSEMTGYQILSNHPTGREYAHLLEGKEVFPVFVDAAGEILSMPPIINSHKTGKITKETKDIFIECSGFDFAILKKTLNILVTLLADMGGKIYQMKIKHKEGNFHTPDLKPEKMKIKLENVNKLLGLDLSEKQMKHCLEKMGYNCKSDEVEIPAWRTDVLHEHDLIEDIAIAHGYDKFEPELPNVQSIGEEDAVEVSKRKISSILAGLNMLEVSSYHLTTIEDMLKKIGRKKEQNVIEIKNSKTEYTLLRDNLLHCVLKILSENADAEYPQRIFELGKVFEKEESEKSETGIKETENLCIAVANNASNFTEIKQILDYLLKMLDKECRIEPVEHNGFIIGRCGKIIIDKTEIGYIGEIAPNILSNLKIKMPVAALEIEIEKLIK